MSHEAWFISIIFILLFLNFKKEIKKSFEKALIKRACRSCVIITVYQPSLLIYPVLFLGTPKILTFKVCLMHYFTK